MLTDDSHLFIILLRKVRAERERYRMMTQILLTNAHEHERIVARLRQTVRELRTRTNRQAVSK
tara:strand:+ start:356 stop:544 length:189 start_codon:yes stop_codon:yes gene_type:complete